MDHKTKLDIIKKCLTVLEKGGVILYPTDTVWGLGCDATNEEAIQKIYTIKKRRKNNPLIILMDNIETLKKYVLKINSFTLEVIKKSKVPTTIIYNSPKNLPKTLIYHQSIAVRIIKEPTLQKLICRFQKPLTSTSANLSGKAAPLSLEAVDPKIKRKVDYIIPEDFIDLNERAKASRILRIDNNSNITVIRE
ncbi:MAG: threonylcarbamoyl-AMP synthase [Flavobacteriales bacterium]|nr:threonylcarbamoyl-AMP synthase [Flavobacteriales bacterium]|tara:strand:- start:3382 stop:3960 length:579 start_codon:yes stop_codon:yes gene_type:complete